MVSRAQEGVDEGPARRSPTDEDPTWISKALPQSRTLADTPEFRAFAADEFPGFATVRRTRRGGTARRRPRSGGPHGASSSRLSAAALGLAGLAGCRRPDIQILPSPPSPRDRSVTSPRQARTSTRPASRAPAARFPYSSRATTDAHEGRREPAARVQHRQHRRARAGVGPRLYSPERVMSGKYPGVMEGKAPRKWEDFDRFARGEAEQLLKDKGKGFSILIEQTPAPSLRACADALRVSCRWRRGTATKRLTRAKPEGRGSGRSGRSWWPATASTRPSASSTRQRLLGNEATACSQPRVRGQSAPART